jgi:hypothetical protein
MVLDVYKTIAEAEAKAAVKLEVLRKAREKYPTAIAKSTWFWHQCCALRR